MDRPATFRCRVAHAGRTLTLLMGGLPALAACAPGASAAASPTGVARVAATGMPMKIRMTIDGRSVSATLDDTGVARDFAALLPLNVTLEDYAVVERIATLPRRLSLDGAPDGTAPANGDIAYYAPWGNLAIFVEGKHDYARGLVRLGKVETGLPALQRRGPFKATIERVED